MTENKIENQEIKNEKKIESEKPKKAKKEIVKKEIAVTRANGIRISLKHSMAIAKFIKGKGIDQAMRELESVAKIKRAIPFKGEIPHRKGDIMAGRYPVNASKAFILVLKGLKGNVIANGMEIDKTIITSVNPSFASRPMRKGGVHGKRVNLIIEAKEAKKNG